MMDDELAGMGGAIEAIEQLIANLERLRSVRANYVRVAGRKGSRQTFARLDASLRALRRAAKT